MKSPGAQALAMFHARIRVLRDRVPARYPVHVRRIAVPGGYVADCSFIHRPTKHFLIRISPTPCQQCLTDSLVHEWAHALSWSDSHPCLTDHDEVYGVAWSRVYRALFPDEPGS